MKKTTLILVLILFAACAVVGYMVASKTKIGSSTGSINSTDSAKALSSAQQNFLLVQVDDLTQTSPKLIQVWIVLTYYSNPPQIMFVPLYPVYDSALNTAINNAFTVDNNGNLSTRLSEKINEHYKVDINGYIMTDATGFNAFVNWFAIQGVQVSSAPAQTDDEKHVILLNSQYFFQNVCSQLKAGGATSQFNSIQWSQLAPSHFQTDLSFELLMASWDKIIRFNAPQKCDVLSNE